MLETEAVSGFGWRNSSPTRSLTRLKGFLDFFPAIIGFDLSLDVGQEGGISAYVSRKFL